MEYKNSCYLYFCYKHLKSKEEIIFLRFCYSSYKETKKLAQSNLVIIKIIFFYLIFKYTCACGRLAFDVNSFLNKYLFPLNF